VPQLTRMIKVNGIANDALVVDGGWIEKHRGAEVRGKVALSDVQSWKINSLTRRKKIVFGEKETLLQLLVRTNGPMLSLTVPEERRGEVDELTAALQEAGATLEE
jgi:hypothetical protein